jgi:ribosomal protein S18 acetylase RimI-like enzyme
VKLAFALATEADAAALAALHNAVADDLTRRYGQGRWSSIQTKTGVLSDLHNPKCSRTLIARMGARGIVGTLRLGTQKPWMIDPGCFTTSPRPLYLTNMAVQPELQRQGIGRLLLQEAEAMARAWPADAIRLDAFDAEAGAGGFYLKTGFREVARVTYNQVRLIYFELMLE